MISVQKLPMKKRRPRALSIVSIEISLVDNPKFLKTQIDSKSRTMTTQVMKSVAGSRAPGSHGATSSFEGMAPCVSHFTHPFHFRAYTCTSVNAITRRSHHRCRNHQRLAPMRSIAFLKEMMKRKKRSNAPRRPAPNSRDVKSIYSFGLLGGR